MTNLSTQERREMVTKIFRPAVLLALLAAMLFAVPAAMATHPDEDVVTRPEPNDDGGQEAKCANADDAFGGWDSYDGELWECLPEDPGAPAPGPFWQPRNWDDWPPEWKAGINWSKRWNPVSIPGYPGVYTRSLSRSEWLNPAPETGGCPNVTGGCKYKAGGDVNFVRNGQPFQINRTWFNRALQTYVYNATTKVWEKKHDTGWMQPAATGPTYVNQMVGTYNYGTAPYGAAWYFTRMQLRVWNGSAWVTQAPVDPVKTDGTLNPIWDDPPGSKVEKVKEPKTKPPKVDKVSKKGATPPATIPEDAGTDLPTFSPSP